MRETAVSFSEQVEALITLLGVVFLLFLVVNGGCSLVLIICFKGVLSVSLDLILLPRCCL